MTSERAEGWTLEDGRERGERTDRHLADQGSPLAGAPPAPVFGRPHRLHAAVHVRRQNRVVRGRERARATRQLCALRKKGPLP